MANREHLQIIKQGVDAWNNWRKENPKVQVDLIKADLRSANLAGANLFIADLRGANLIKADLRRANLTEANFIKADLSGAILSGAILSGAILAGANLFIANLIKADLGGANLFEADLRGATLAEANLIKADLGGANLFKADLRSANLTEVDLIKADLRGATLIKADLRGATLINADLRSANLTEANLFEADLRGVDLRGASLISVDLRCANLTEGNLRFAMLLDTNFENATLNGCKIFGISAWNLKLNEKTKQSNLIITQPEDPIITIDNLEVAQFIYLLLHNEKIRQVIDTITSKFILILGGFTDERKAVLEAIRHEIRKLDYSPILFDFDKPTNPNLTETIFALARMARFIIADITDRRSIPQELQRIIPHLPSVPIQPLIQGSSSEYGMSTDFKDYPWVLAIHRYRDLDDLLSSLKEKVIEPAEAKVKELGEGKIK